MVYTIGIVFLYLSCSATFVLLVKFCLHLIWGFCVFTGRFNISPISVNISTTEFSLLASPLKVIPENIPRNSVVDPFNFIIYSTVTYWLSDTAFVLLQTCKCLLVPLQSLYSFCSLGAGWWEWGGHHGRRCPAFAVAALGDQRSCCGLYSLWPQTHQYHSHYQVLFHMSGFFSEQGCSENFPACAVWFNWGLLRIKYHSFKTLSF